MEWVPSHYIPFHPFFTKPNNRIWIYLTPFHFTTLHQSKHSLSDYFFEKEPNWQLITPSVPNYKSPLIKSVVAKYKPLYKLLDAFIFIFS